MKASRVDAIDAARGIALIGMMLVHLGPRPMVFGETPPLGDVIAGGRAAPLFALLAGVALSLVLARDPRGAGSVWATVVRVVLLMLLGLSLGSLTDVPIYIILCQYALLILLAVPFRRLPAGVLLGLGAAWAVLVPVAMFAILRTVDVVPTDQVMWSDVESPTDLLMMLLVWGAYPVVVWFAYLLVGLGMGRLDLSRVATGARVAVVGLVLLVTTLLAGWIAIAADVFGEVGDVGWQLLVVGDILDQQDWATMLVVGQHTSTPLNVVSVIGSALLVVGLCVVAMSRGWLRAAAYPLRAAGSMTLSLYTAHVVWAWTWRDRADGSYEGWLLQVVVLVVAATLWRRFVGRGPLEWVVRQLSLPPRVQA